MSPGTIISHPEGSTWDSRGVPSAALHLASTGWHCRALTLVQQTNQRARNKQSVIGLTNQITEPHQHEAAT
ncbi:unnamed protein product [Gadus morhua 'NCC']